MNRMRLRIAQRLKDAQNTYAMLTTFNEIDMRSAPTPPPQSNSKSYSSRLILPLNIISTSYKQSTNCSIECFVQWSHLPWLIGAGRCSNAMALRKKHQDAFVKKHGSKLGFMSIFSKATAYALQDQPIVNAGRRPHSVSVVMN